jgi:toxin-antitoxin system PIN domain toxin
MIALDANLLVYAIRADAPHHAAALKVVRQLAEGDSQWLLPWPCVHEFLAISTHPRVYSPPTPQDRALNFMTRLLASPAVEVGHETSDHWRVLRQLLEDAGTTGPAVHDARVAAICIEHGASALYSADRDFTKFAGLKVVNPLAF